MRSEDKAETGAGAGAQRAPWLTRARRDVVAGAKALAADARRFSQRMGPKAKAAAALGAQTAAGIARKAARALPSGRAPGDVARASAARRAAQGGHIAMGASASGGAGGGGASPTPRRSGGRGRFWRAALVETACVAFTLSLAGAAAALFAGFVLMAPRIHAGADLWEVNREPSIVLLDRNGAELISRGSRYGRQVSLDELPPYLIQAFLATEDRRFYQHNGIDPRGMARAALVNLRRGGVVEGGSTITQQLARNLFLSPRQTWDRKAREALLALWIEGRYSKDQILTLYLNRIYMGAGAYGVDAAARVYFGKSAREVTLAEAVMLAGLPKAPSQLAPTLNPYGAQSRALQVLENLRDTGAVTEFAAREARLNPPVIADGAANLGLGYFYDHVAREARARADGRRGDLIVTTTLDARLQRDAEAAVRAGLTTEAKLAGAEQAALIAYDAKGGVLAMVGGRSYLESQFNRATQAKRQTGSAFKPFVYVAALEAGLTPQSTFVDQPVTVDGWSPTNYVDAYEGRMLMTTAVAKSTNTVAVQASEYAGRDKVVAAARRLGVRSPMPLVPSIALGSADLSLDELTAAYIPFGQGGRAVSPYAILRIEDQNLQIIYQHTDRPPEQAISPQIAEAMTHLLYQVIIAGTGARASLGARDAAGKTGTTNDWRDAWFVGYTAQITAGVWVGNDLNQSMNRVTGGTIPAEIWRNFMTAAHQGLPRVALKGAYPASGQVDQSALMSFYQEVRRGFLDVRRDGDERRGRR